MSTKKSELGKIGEDFASTFLSKNGIDIFQRNYFTKFGEIDLIGIENKTIIFIEVRLRTKKNYGLPYESLSKSKLDRIHKSIEIFLSDNNFDNYECRFDVLSLVFNDDKQLFSVEWLKNQDFS